MEIEAKSKPHQGFNVKVARIKKKGWKQSVLGEKLQLTQDQMSRLENQEVIEDELLIKIAKLLDCSVDYLKNEDLEELMGSFGSGSVIHNDNSTFDNHSFSTGENAQVEEYVNQKSETIHGQTIIHNSVQEVQAAYEKFSKANLKIGRLEVTLEFAQKENESLKLEVEALKKKLETKA